MPQMGESNFIDPMHSREIDIMGLKMAQALPDVQLYCLCEESELAKYLPLAPVVNEKPQKAQEKRADALKDFAQIPPRPHTHFGPGRRFVDKYDLWPEYEELNKNIYMYALRDLLKLFKMIPRVLKKVLFPARKKTSSASKKKRAKTEKEHEKETHCDCGQRPLAGRD